MDKILILDFGSQVAQLIARRVREAHVYCELHPFDMSLEDIKAFKPTALFCLVAQIQCMNLTTKPTLACWIWASLYWAFATACNGWRM